MQCVIPASELIGSVKQLEDLLGTVMEYEYVLVGSISKFLSIH